MAVSSIGDTTTSVQLAPSDSALDGVSITNTSSAILYVLQGLGTASISNYSVAIPSGGHWESPHRNYVRGGLTGIWASDAGGAALVTTW